VKGDTVGPSRRSFEDWLTLLKVQERGQVTTIRENTSNQQVGSNMRFETALAVHVDIFAIRFAQ